MISIIICTHNRAEMLKDTLSSFSDMQGLEDVEHELMVIDNNSSDNTRMIVDETSNIQSLRYVVEEELGLSHARNRGIKESTGEFIAFVDDDVFFTEKWLIELKKGIERWPDAAVYGGKAVAKWEIPKPSWFVDDGFFQMRSMIAHFEPNIPEGYMDRFPYGCNMAFTRSIIEKMEFSGNLGRKGKILYAGEEWDIFIQIKKLGGQFVYLPEAAVYHRVTRDRGVREYYLRWVKAHSKTQVLIWNKHYATNKNILGIPLQRIKFLIKVTIKIMKDFFFLWDTKRFFAYKIKLLRAVYYIQRFKNGVKSI